MGKISVKVMVQGGKAVPGPPLGPALAQHKVNIGQVVSQINEKTKEFAGISVPVEVKVDTETKAFEIAVGSPPVSQLIKKELKAEVLAKTAWKEPAVGNMTMPAVVKMAKSKMSAFGTKSIKNAAKVVAGSCVSCGVMIEGKNPKEIIKEINAGKWDAEFK
ncbi:MAG: 50S ribosomal protein L11 [Candidatus Aenigmatarchaeota archaeon]